MKPFYSIVYIKPDSLSEEKIAVGLLLNADNKPVFDYSIDKLKVAAKLIDAEAVESVKRLFKNISKEIEKYFKTASQKEAFEITPFSYNYFEYLSRYSNNLLLYSNPEENFGNFDSGDFRELFRLLIDKEYGVEELKEISFKDEFEYRIKNSKVSNRLDIKYRLSKKRVPTILSNTEVDYIGANGCLYTGHVVDTHSRNSFVENKLYKIRSLVIGLNKLSVKLGLNEKGEHIVYFNEPKNDSEKDLLFRLTKDETLPFSVEHWEYFAEEEKRLEEGNVGKFSSFIRELGL
jgi:hypothetical protein